MNPAPGVDLSGFTARELCSWLEEELDHGVRARAVDRYAHLALAELENRLTSDASPEPVQVLSVAVTEALRRELGPNSRSFTPSYRRALFALKVWRDKYGPLTPEQAEYADELLLHAIATGGRNAVRGRLTGSKTGVQGYVNAQLDRIVNHENTHEGFQRRADQGLDVTDILKEVLA